MAVNGIDSMSTQLNEMVTINADEIITDTIYANTYLNLPLIYGPT